MRKVSTVLFFLYLLSLGAMFFFGLYPETPLIEIITATSIMIGVLLVAALLGSGMGDRGKEIRELEQKNYENLKEINFIKRVVGILGSVKDGWSIDKSAYMPVSSMCEKEFRNWEEYTKKLSNKLASLGDLLGYTNILKTTAAKPEISEYVWEKKADLVKAVNKKK
jgi:hypothetical protein